MAVHSVHRMYQQISSLLLEACWHTNVECGSCMLLTGGNPPYCDDITWLSVRITRPRPTVGRRGGTLDARITLEVTGVAGISMRSSSAWSTTTERRNVRPAAVGGRGGLSLCCEDLLMVVIGCVNDALACINVHTVTLHYIFLSRTKLTADTSREKINHKYAIYTLFLFGSWCPLQILYSSSSSSSSRRRRRRRPIVVVV